MQIFTIISLVSIGVSLFNITGWRFVTRINAKTIKALESHVKAAEAKTGLMLPTEPIVGPTLNVWSHTAKTSVHALLFIDRDTHQYQLCLTQADSSDMALTHAREAMKMKSAKAVDWVLALNGKVTVEFDEQEAMKANPHADYVSMLLYARDKFADDPAEKVILNGIISKVEKKYDSAPR